MALQINHPAIFNKVAARQQAEKALATAKKMEKKTILVKPGESRDFKPKNR